MIQEECKSLLHKLKLQQKNLKNFLPSKYVTDSIVNETTSDDSDVSIWSSPGQSSYARSKLKTLISSNTNGTDSLQSSFNGDVSIDCPKKQILKSNFYQLERQKTSNNEYENATSKETDSIQVMTPPRSVKVSGNFLRDINDYFDESKDLTMTSLNSDYTSVHHKPAMSPTISERSSLPSTPNTAQKRSIIDRNVPVASRYDDFQFDTNTSKLNYSYSTVEDDEESFLKSRLNESPEDIFLKYDKDYKMAKRDREHKEMEEFKNLRSSRNKDMNFRDKEIYETRNRLDTRDNDKTDLREKGELKNKIVRDKIDQREIREKEELKTQHYEELYKKQLKDSGNDKSFVSITRDSIQPRSILSSPGSRNSSKSKSSVRVSFKSNSFNNGQEDEVPLTSKLMGYDWIAALLDNETGQIDESESFFQELKEFRRSNRDECCNNFYMNNTLTYAEPKEEPPVVQALTEPKVKPYVVNDRLFTEPLKKKLDDDNLNDSEHEDDKPSQEQPRYVRVSIPRSTLEKPYKVKPHRRNSFDPTDSCSLREHCLMGWENSRVSALPTASSVDINEATKGLKPKMTTTLAEAELTARTGSTQMWPFVPLTTRIDPLPTWRKHYEASAMNCSQATLPNSTILGDSDSLRHSTNSLLNSTYSLMYEMQRLKKERESTKA